MRITVKFKKITKDVNAYQYGYSEEPNPLLVSNWQESNIFNNIPNGEYWFFAQSIDDPNEYYIVFKKVSCVDGVEQCTILIRSGVTKKVNCSIRIISGITVEAPPQTGVAKKGRAIIGINTGTVEPLPGSELAFTDFELNTLPGLIDGTNDVSEKNTLGFEVFPSVNGMPTSSFTPLFIWGDGIEFLNHSGDTPPIALQKGLATGFDNAALNSLAGVPAQHRHKWTLFNDPVFWAQSDAELLEEGADAYEQMLLQSRDSNNVLVPFSFTMLDIEAGVEDFSKISTFVRGYLERAIEDNPNHRVILYTYSPNKGFVYWHNGFYYDGDSVSTAQKFFPYSKPAYNNTKAKVSSGIMTSYFKGKNVFYNVMVNYMKQNLPLTSTMYQTSGGNFVLDGNGNRVFRTDQFTETQRGETITWYPAGVVGDISPEEGNNYGEYRLMPSVYHAAHQFAGMYSDIFFRLQMIANELGLGYDFQNIHSLDTSYKMIGMLRHDMESYPNTNAYRPQDRVTAQWFSGMVFTLLNNLSLWTGFTGGNIGLTKQGTYVGGSFVADIHKSSNEGDVFLQDYFGEGFQKNEGHSGNYRQIAAKVYQMQAENREAGLWQKTDKILAFCHPEKVIDGHCPIIGRLNANYLQLTGVESKLEIGESFVVTVKNTKNNYSETKTIESKKVLNTLITLPVGTYNAQDIIVEYTNPVKGGLQKVNGRAETVS